jgi:hypothetical protein
MKFVVTGTSNVPDYRDAFVVEVQVMYGDADGYGDFEIGPFAKDKDDALLEDFVTLCKGMDAAYPHGRGGDDNYNHVPGFNEWFDSENHLTEEEWEALPQRQRDLGRDWPYDPQGDGVQASFEKYEVFYYDETGVKFDVKVIS